MLTEVTHWMGLVPLTWLVALRVTGRPRDVAYWWIALAFSVSWIADTLAHWVNPDVAGNLYPLTQAALIGATLLTKTDRWFFLLVLTNVGIGAVFFGARYDVFLSTVAFGTITGIVWDRPALGWLRASLLAYCGLGLVAWWAYSAFPWFTVWPIERGWFTWGLYQACRAAGLALFCYACLHPAPKLRVT